MNCNASPSSLQYGLGAITFALGLTGTYLLYRTWRIETEAAGLINPHTAIGQVGAVQALVTARLAARRRKLIELAGYNGLSGGLMLFYSLIAGLTINFPVFWTAAIVVIVAGVATILFLRSRGPELDRRLDLFVRWQAVHSVSSGAIAELLATQRLQAYVTLRPAKLLEVEAKLAAEEAKNKAQLDELHAYVKKLEDDADIIYR